MHTYIFNNFISDIFLIVSCYGICNLRICFIDMHLLCFSTYEHFSWIGNLECVVTYVGGVCEVHDAKRPRLSEDVSNTSSDFLADFMAPLTPSTSSPADEFETYLLMPTPNNSSFAILE